MNLFDFLDYSDTYAPASVLLLYIWKQKSLPKLSFLIKIYLIVSIITFSYSNWLASSKANNLFLYHFFNAFNYYLFCTYIYLLVGNKFKIVIVACSILFTLFLFINILLWEPLNTFNTNSGIVSFLLLIFVMVVYYLNLIELDDIFELKYTFPFWIATGVLFYSATCTFIYFFYKYDKNINSTVDKLLWVIQDIATIIKYLLFSLGMIWYHRKPIYHG